MSQIQNMSDKKAWGHTVPFDAEHWDVWMKSTKAARAILVISILMISLRAADIVHALQAEDLWAWPWKGGYLNRTDTVRFFFFSSFFLFNEKVSCFRLAHFNILLLVKKGGWEGSRGNRHKHKHIHFLACLHGYHTPEMTKMLPHSLPDLEKKWCVSDSCQTWLIRVQSSVFTDIWCMLLKSASARGCPTVL